MFYRSYFNILKETSDIYSAVHIFEEILELNKEKPYFKTYVLDKTFLNLLRIL
ncbi:hypothetical protein PL321_10725 [Caloramator sp. mosi_1]|uniref:hypothetical protein n=1 Tax=Caloramator sp. mosi_1 TaxID=3023090 RepID=UPI00236201B3|nr:hypothetical protein [Caloramator sp. mosi_1]WDC83259.1 hypothetical protein PL321_10725 [Caloramator sp. mosi_1]